MAYSRDDYLAALRDNPYATQTEIAEIMGRTRSSVCRAVADLLDEGLVREGTCKTCGRAKWEVADG